jgi:hypothetical protein
MCPMTADAVKMPRETAIDLLAALDLAGDLFAAPFVHDDDVADYLGALRERLVREVFGAYTEGDDDPWTRDSHVVAIHARSAEMQADVLERTPAGRITDLSSEDHVVRRARLRELAVTMRERGTIDVPLQVGVDA